MTIQRTIKVWFRTRPYRQLWAGLPALLAWAAVVGFVFTVVAWRPVRAQAGYDRVVTDALGRRDYETARVACERLLNLGGEARGRNLFLLGLSLGGLGRVAEAGALLGLAAPFEKPGYLPAHMYQAKSLLGVTNPSPQMIKMAEVHLSHIIALEPQSVEANEMLGRIYIQMGKWDAAKRHLLEVVPSKPGSALLLSVVARQLGDATASKAWAERATKHYREAVEKSKVENPEDRLAWARSLVLQEDYPGALSVLETGWKQTRQKVYQAALGDLCASWAQGLARSKPEDIVARIKIVSSGLEYTPQNLILLRQLIDFSHLDGAAGEAARATLTKMLTEGGAAPVLHFILGGDAWERGQMDEAHRHLTLAYEGAPQMPYVANNMAMLLTMGEKPDPARALAMIQPLVEKYPGEPSFRDTRGQVLVKLGRWQEAVSDLEHALPSLSSKRMTHAALAEAYRGLNMKDLAAQHEKLAKGETESRPEGGSAPKP